MSAEHDFELTEDIAEDWGTYLLDDVLAHCRAEMATLA